MTSTGPRIRAVGAAAPSLRVAAADIGAAWGRARPGPGRRLRARRGHPHPGLGGRDRGARRGRDRRAERSTRSSGGRAGPPFAEGPSLAVPRRRARLCPATSGGALARGLGARGHGGARPRAPTRSPRARRAIALVVASDALRPGLGTGFEARCGAGAAAVVLGDRRRHAALGDAGHAHPPVRRPLPRRRRDRQPRPLRRAPVPRGDLPARVVEVVDRARRRSTCARGRSPIPTAGSAPWSRRRSARRPPRRPRSYASDRRHRRGRGVARRASRAMDAAGHGRDRRHRRRPHDRRARRTSTRRCRARRRSRPRSTTGARRRTPKLLRARGQLVPGGETIPMGVPPESAMFVRGADEMLGLLGGRCVDCGTISTPPSIHPHCINCGGPKLEPVALARGGTVHTYVVNHTMPAPFVAPLPIAVLDMDDGARLMLQVDRRRHATSRSARRVELVLRKYAHERGVPVYGFKARPVRGGTESVQWLGTRWPSSVPGSSRWASCSSRATSRWRRARSRPRSRASTRASSRTRSTPRSSPPSAARCGARRASAATRSRPRSASTASRAPASRTRARRAPTRSGSARWRSRAACTTSCS